MTVHCEQRLDGARPSAEVAQHAMRERKPKVRWQDIPKRSDRVARDERFVPSRKGQAPPNKGKRYIPDPPTDEEFLRLLDACPPGKAGHRNRTLLVLLRRTGLRISEALDLKPLDLDLEACTVLVRCGKGGKMRKVGIDRQAAAVVSDWLKARERLGLDHTTPVFCGVNKGAEGSHLQTGYIRTLLPRLARQAGISRRIHAHGLRHALAVELARRGVPVPYIAIQLGHESVATTTKYLVGLSPQEVIDVMALLTWGDQEGRLPDYSRPIIEHAQERAAPAAAIAATSYSGGLS